MKSLRIPLIAVTLSVISINASTIAWSEENPPGQSRRIQQEFGDLLPKAQAGDLESMKILGDLLLECLLSDSDSYPDPEPDYCIELTLDDRRTAFHWLEMGAKNGNAISAMGLLGTLGRTANTKPSELDRPEMKKLITRAFIYAEDALLAGETRVLLTMSSLYEYGLLVEQDFESAFAYRFAYGLANVGANETTLNRLAEHLTDEQISAAESKGQVVFSRCCAHAIDADK